MNELQIFTNEQFGNVRTIVEGETVLFCGADVAKALGYSRPNDAVSSHCRSTVKRRIATSQGNESDMCFIPEGDVYRLIVRSYMPEAEKFERWLFEEVIPTIRKHGGYLTPDKLEEALLNPDTLIRLATDLKAERTKRLELEEQNAKMLPLAKFAEAVTDSEDTVDMSTVAKVLNIQGLGRNKIFEILRNHGILDWKNEPYQRYVNEKWFKCSESLYYVYGLPKVNVKTVIYQKGMMKIRELLEKLGYTDEMKCV